MRNLCKVSLSLALVALLAAPALAQRPGGFGFGGGNLLTNKSVQEELKITKEQKEKIDEANKAVREKMQKAFQDFQDLKPEERREKFQALQKETTEMLNKAANLTAEQKKRIAKDAQEKIREETKDLEMNFESFRKRMEIAEKVNKEAMGKVAAKLTKQQRETWTKMRGEPFEVKREFRRPGGGGARPQRNDL